MTVKDQYKLRFGHSSDVQLNDVVFALHALALTVITIGQCCWYRGDETVSRSCQIGTGATVIVAAGYGLLTWAGVVATLDLMFLLRYSSVSCSAPLNVACPPI